MPPSNGYRDLRRGRYSMVAEARHPAGVEPDQNAGRTLGHRVRGERPARTALRRKIAEWTGLVGILLRANAEDATVKRMSEQVEALRAQHNVRRTLMRFALYRRLGGAAFGTRRLRRTDDEMRSGPSRDSDR